MKNPNTGRLQRMFPDKSDQSQRNVLFRVTSGSPLMASVRYRAMLPAMGLGELGFKCEIRDSDLPDRTVRQFRCIVFMKAFRHSDLCLALRAKVHGIPVILDLCDNIFVPNYAGEFGRELLINFKAMAGLAAAIVTPSPALGAIIRGEIANCPEIVEIGDPVEDRNLISRLLKKYPLPTHLNGPRTYSSLAIRAARLLINDPRAFSQKAKPILAARVRRALRATINRVFPPSFYNGEATVANPETAPEKTLLWFGNHGAAHGDFGMLTVLPLLPSLIRVAKKIPIKLVIVSNNAEKFEHYFAKLPFPTEYQEWDLLKIFDHVKAADVCLIPNSGDSFSLTKSPNRAVLSLHHDTPVVAAKTPALEEFSHCIAFDSWEKGILTYLTDKKRVQDDVANAHALIDSTYALPVIARRWADLIARHLATTSIQKRVAGHTVLLMISQIADAEVLLPVLDHLQRRPGWEAKLWLASDVMIEAPRIMDAINSRPVATLFGTRETPGLDMFEQLSDVDTMLVSDRALGDQGIVKVAAWAKLRGIPLYALQAELSENVPIKRFGRPSARPDVSLIWANPPSGQFKAKDLPPQIMVGCPRPIASGDQKQRGAGASLAIIEDLDHPTMQAWRVSAQAIEVLLESFPDLAIVFVPRPRDTAQIESCVSPKWQGRVRVVDLDGGDNDIRLPNIIADATAVIAAPSNVVLDAARSDRPLAINAPTDAETARQAFAPLPILCRPEDWKQFVDAVLCGRDDRSLRQSYAAKTAGPFDAIERILQALEEQSGLTQKLRYSGGTAPPPHASALKIKE